jgi:hypothetical protein
LVNSNADGNGIKSFKKEQNNSSGYQTLKYFDENQQID